MLVQVVIELNQPCISSLSKRLNRSPSLLNLEGVQTPSLKG